MSDTKLTADQRAIIKEEVMLGIIWRRRPRNASSSTAWVNVAVGEEISDSYEYSRLDLWCVTQTGEVLEMKPWSAKMHPRSYVYRNTAANCEKYVKEHTPKKYWLFEKLKTLPESEKDKYLQTALEVRRAIIYHCYVLEENKETFTIADLEDFLVTSLGIDADLIKEETEKALKKQKEQSDREELVKQQQDSRDIFG